ncbi:MAG TPA: NAD(P)-dependent oxidoreductase [Fimbriimonadaceae bacterium]|nr:NAD(P)-dependent oxidoreductase [Fimbriimonadaceae bacterium]
MKIMALELSGEDAEFFQSQLKDHEVICAECTSETADWEAGSESEVLSVMVHSRVGAEEMERLPQLKLIATRSTGFDHIDLDEAGKRGIVVSNVPAYGSNTVAEHTFALILALSRKVHKAYLRSLQGEFHLHGLMGSDLAGKTLGVIGAGRIGQHVVRIGKGFGMNVLAFDPVADPHYAELLGYRLVSFEELLEQSDVISVCCPLNDSTRHLLDREAFGKMKRGALLVNTARGAVVDSDALLWGLDEGIVEGAALDVLEGEEMLAEDALVSSLVSARSSGKAEQLAENLVLMRHPNVIVTPHMAFYSKEALRRILETTVSNIRAYVQGEPANTVSKNP